MSTEEKAEALRLDSGKTNYAEWWEAGKRHVPGINALLRECPHASHIIGAEMERRDAELRRLYAENERLRADAALVRDQALEDAALVCDKRIAYWMEGDLRRVEDESCARLIRALKASPDAKG